MENYKIQKRLGDGTYGCVYKATHVKTGDIVAIKKFKRKYASWDECMQLREIKSLRKLTHPNIIKLKEVLKEQDELNLVFEYLERNVFEAYMEYKNKGEKISESTIKNIMRQLIEGLAYMHKHGYFHRDLKPENLLMYGDTVKICDFGLAREIRSRPPYTDYVATRWYRAPEILLKQTNYNSPVDIFAVGCIMAELYMLAPLFSGQSEIDQLNKICQIMGTPNSSNWPEASKLANQAGITLPQCQPQALEYIISNCSPEGIYVIQQMLLYDPSKRPSAQQILSFPYFTDVKIPQQALVINQNIFAKPSKHEERVNFGKIGESQVKDTKTNFYDVGSHEAKKKKDDKFRDSSTNFLDFLDAKLSEQDKQWNTKVDKNKQTGTIEKFNPKATNSKDPEDVFERDLHMEDSSNKRNNPFKLLKYNDPIGGGAGSSSVNHHYEPTRQSKPVSMIHTNQFQQVQYQLPYTQGKSSILPKPDLSPSMMNQNLNIPRMPQQLGQPKIPMYYQSRIHQNYGRLGENLVGQARRNLSNNNKYDEFGFNKPNKQYGNY